jgi:hypothetical protein
MRCSQHIESEAVAVCVSCGRAVCRDCQKATLTERVLCGLPQCAEFEKRERAVQFAVRHDCANQATQYQALTTLLQFVSVLLVVLSLFGLFWAFVLNPLLAVGVPSLRFEAVVVTAFFVAFAWALRKAAKKLRAIAGVYEDLAREFD